MKVQKEEIDWTTRLKAWTTRLMAGRHVSHPGESQIPIPKTQPKEEDIKDSDSFPLTASSNFSIPPSSPISGMDMFRDYNIPDETVVHQMIREYSLEV